MENNSIYKDWCEANYVKVSHAILNNSVLTVEDKLVLIALLMDTDGFMPSNYILMQRASISDKRLRSAYKRLSGLGILTKEERTLVPDNGGRPVKRNHFILHHPDTWADNIKGNTFTDKSNTFKNGEVEEW